jgi:peptide/nickel transport system substrate-binding protein
MRSINWAAAAAAALVLTAPLARAETVFKWANDGDVRALDPYTLDETVQNSFLQNIYEPLVKRSKTLGLEPGLATSWKLVNPTTWEFKIRQGVKWQDGTPFTADDVLFSIQRIKSKTSSTSTNVATVADVKKVDDATVDFITSVPDPLLPSELTNVDILPKAWMTAHDSAEPAIVGKNENYALLHTMGTGPYELVSREPDRKTVLQRNPGWWGKLDGNVDRVEFNVISNAATRVAALLSGEMDMIYSVPPQDMDRIAHSPGVKLLVTPELRTIYFGFDVTRPELLHSSVKGKNPFKDLRVREAFAKAIDENAIVRSVMRGQARSTWEMMGPGVNGFNPAMNTRPKVDIAGAKKLLADAGYPNGFEVQLDCPNDRYVADAQICTAAAAMLAKIGIKVDVYARTKTKFFADVNYPKYDTSMWLIGWTPSTYDAQNVFISLLGSQDPKTGRGLYNLGAYSNPKLDALIDAMGPELDQKKRQDMINEAIAIVQHDLPTIPLHQQSIVWAARDNISLVQPADNTFPMRWVTKK